MNSPDSEALVQQVKARDGEALARYIEANRTRLLGFLRSITSDRLRTVVELEDLLQEVSTAALTGLTTAPLDRYEPIDWLQQLARRRVVDAHRFHFEAQRRDAAKQQSIHGGGEAGTRGGGLEALLAASMTTPSAVMSRDVRLGRLQQALATLPDQQQTVIQMRYGEGLTTKQIGERLGKTDVAVRVLLSRCMRQLEQQLEDVRPSPR